MTGLSKDRNLTEEALRRSEARFAGILAIAADAIISIDADQRITLFNDWAEKLFGYSREEALGQPLDILIPGRFRAGHSGHITQFASSRSTARKMGDRQEIFALRKDGSEFPAEASISKLEIDGEHTYTVVLRDISERKESEAALRESEQRLWAFLNNSSVIGWMKDEAGRYVFASANCKHRFGPAFENVTGKTDADVWPARLADEYRRTDDVVRSTNRRLEVLEEAMNADGSQSWWILHKFPFRDAKGQRFVGGLGIDITERVKAEEALAESHAVLEERVQERTRALEGEMQRREAAQAVVAHLQRMESLGQLTGGVAHDFNNLLTVISGNLQLIEMDLEDARLRRYLDEAVRAAEMGARLNQRLMTFAKQRRLTATAVNLNEQVIGVRELLRRSLGETVTLSTHLAESLWLVHVDPSEIENALVNLAINARDAMQDGGTLTVSSANVTLEEGDVPSEAGIAPGPYVLLSVSDTGTGMTPDVKARAFEPFFTTKEHGKGTGLGLATIYGFVRQSGGYIALESQPGKGTTFRIYLPRLVKEATGSSSTGTGARPLPASGETILVVEDNVAVRRVTVERLKALGYRVEEAEDGRRAIERLEQGPAPSLVFSDVVMPGGLSGFDLAREIAKRWPELNVLLTSGFAADEAAEKGDGLEEIEILGKPYSQEALARAITAALRKGRT
jgi:PAS domain S-box-containing protein